ncbi:MAG: ribbon-helix-helix protein, CopG family [Pseudomonadota bacterium]
MRLTLHIPVDLEKEIKKAARNEKRSVSSLVTEAAAYYLKEKRKRKLGKKVLELAGKTRVADDILEELQKERRHDDRS